MKIVIASILFVFVSGFAYAHSGGTASDGCHEDHRTGTRHCH